MTTTLLKIPFATNPCLAAQIAESAVTLCGVQQRPPTKGRQLAPRLAAFDSAFDVYIVGQTRYDPEVEQKSGAERPPQKWSTAGWPVRKTAFRENLLRCKFTNP